MPVRKSAAKRLKNARKAANYTQKDAAKALNKSLYTYRSWEWGEKLPSNPEDMIAICDLYNITLDWWLRGQHPDSTNQLAKLPQPIQQTIRLLIDQIAG